MCVSVLPLSACQRRRHRRHRFDPWVRKIPWRRRWQPAPVFLPGGSHGQRSLVGYSPGGHKELDRTEHARMWYSLVRIDCISFFFSFLFFWPCGTTCRISVPRPGTEPHPLQWKCGALTTGLPKKSLDHISFIALPVTWHLGCVHSLATVSSVAMNTRVDTCFYFSWAST